MTVTLETLRADYEAAFAAWLNDPNYVHRLVCYNHWSVDKVVSVLGEGVDLRHERNSRMPVAATQYLIARDHGLEAAMLYKLSDGAIDPR